jgi:hypothetical protein
MPRVRLEPTTPVFKREVTVFAIDHCYRHTIQDATLKILCKTVPCQ